jgi:hypothetical protein
MTCAICGKPENEHHDFVPRVMPKGCKCDPGTWDADSIRPVCESHEGHDDSYCQNCCHDKACHEGQG